MADILSAYSAEVDRATAELNRVREEIGKVIVGQTDVIEGVLICLIAGGHVLLEGVPGLGKTTLLRTLARVLDLRYSRIQFTPDLMPGDIVGSMIMENDEHGHKNLRFQQGPIFANLVLADEINRATPKTQSALLEAMQERTVTSGNSSYQLELPFLVMATQNPIEMEGTYPLPEAQLDRFLMKILVTYPSREDLNRIVEVTTKRDEVELEPVMNRGADRRAQSVLPPGDRRPACAELCHRADHGDPTRHARRGGGHQPVHPLRQLAARSASADRMRPRDGAHARAHALEHRRCCGVAPSVLRHRIILNFDAHADGETTESLLEKILKGVASSS